MFSEFWKQYPRKVSRKMAEKAWLKLSTTEQDQALEALPTHIKYWQTTNTEKEFIPHASTWLNQARYEDELEIPQPKKEIVAWWGSESLILAKGREMNLQPRPGESIWDFKGRILEKLRSAA